MCRQLVVSLAVSHFGEEINHTSDAEQFNSIKASAPITQLLSIVTEVGESVSKRILLKITPNIQHIPVTTEQ